VNKPVLFCHDGSDGSRTALAAAVELIKPADAVVLVVWMPAAVQLARAGSFGELQPSPWSCLAREAVPEGVAKRRRAYRRCVRNVSACSTPRQPEMPICRHFSEAL
jgi:hypothetical protein